MEVEYEIVVCRLRFRELVRILFSKKLEGEDIPCAISLFESKSRDLALTKEGSANDKRKKKRRLKRRILNRADEEEEEEQKWGVMSAGIP